MSELEKLKQERKVLDEKIKALSGIPVYKRCKIDFQDYPTDKPTRYFVAIKYQPIGGRAKYQTVFSSNDRNEVVEAIPSIVEELQRLYEIAKANETVKDCQWMR